MEDFSFPTIASEQEASICQLPFPHFPSSPFWFSALEQKAQENQSRSFFSAEKDSKTADNTKRSISNELPKQDDKNPELLRKGSEKEYLSAEERMDMLWEYFNEELCERDRKVTIANGLMERTMLGSFHADIDAEEHTELCCVQALGVTNGVGSILHHHHKPSLLMLLKVVKKVLLIQKNSSSKRPPLP